MIRFFTKFFIAISLLFAIENNTYAQSFEGTDFWFGYLENYPDQEIVHQVHIVSDVATSGTVSVPLAGWTQNFTVAANTVRTITLPLNLVNHTDISDVLSPRGVHLVTNDPCVVYIGNYEPASSDAATAIPTPSLGTLYHVIEYAELAKSNYGYGEFIVIGTEDNTNITIDQTFPSINRSSLSAANNPYTIIIDKGETYHLKAIPNILAPNDFIGTTITSDKPVAVYAGNYCTDVGYCKYCDHLFEQIRPVNTWSYQYFSASVATGSVGISDVLRVYSPQVGTSYTFNGVTFTLGARAFQEHNINGGFAIISNNPIHVSQYLRGSTCTAPPLLIDPLMIDVLAKEQYGSSYLFATSSFVRYAFDRHYATVVIPTTQTATLELNGAPLAIIEPISGGAGIWTPIPGSTYSYGYVQLNRGFSYKINSTNNTPFGLYVYGYGSDESYGYTAGGKLQNFCNVITTDTNVCFGESAKLLVSSPYPDVLNTYNWYKNPTGGAILGTGSEFNTPVLTSTDSFYVQVNNIACNNARQKVKIKVGQLNLTTTTTNTLGCGQANGTGTVTPLNGVAPYTYLWSDSLAQTDSIATGLRAGVYTVNVTAFNNCSRTKTITINDAGTDLNSSITDTVHVKCFGTNTGEAEVTPALGTGVYTSYVWKDVLGNIIGNTARITGLIVGEYGVTVTDNGNCKTSSAVTIKQPEELAPSAGNNFAICKGSNKQLSGYTTGGVGPYNYQWKGSDGFTSSAQNPSVSPTVNTNYMMYVTDKNNCIDSVPLKGFVSNIDPLTPSSTQASGCGPTGTASIALPTGGIPPYEYRWNSNPPQFNPTAINLAPGTYRVTVKDSAKCEKIQDVIVTAKSAVIADAGTNKANCLGRTVQLDGSASGGTPPYTYYWESVPDKDTLYTEDPIITITDNFQYMLIATDANNCNSNVKVISVSVLPGPDVDAISGSTVVCEGDPAVLTASSSNPNVTYYWFDDPSATQVLDSTTTFTTPPVYTARRYYVLAKDNSSTCSGGLDTVTITTNSAAVLTAPDVQCSGEREAHSITFAWTNVTGAAFYQVSTDGGNTYRDVAVGKNDTTISGLKADTTVNVLVRAYKAINCGPMEGQTATAKCQTAPETEFHVPDGFSPNGDGINDVFKPYVKGVSNYYLGIFNRWGEEIFSTKEMSGSWNGKYGNTGDDVTQGVYIYLVKFNDTKGKIETHTGSLILQR